MIPGVPISLTRAASVLLLAATLASAEVPTPQAFFGHSMGQDRSSVDWEKVVAYFHALAKSSLRLRIEDIGPTSEKRPMIAVFIAAPETLANLPRYLAIQKRLADPRNLSDGEAIRLTARGKAVVMVTCSIHSTEPASTHSAIEFAYRLATATDEKTRSILANTILILVPSLNPDGVDIVTRWYRRTLNTPYEGATPPELYQKYTGHDNNRDWYIFSQPETRNVVSRLHNVWHPQIVYDVHEQGPYGSRFFVPPWLDPIDPNVDPILAQMGNAIGMTIALDLTAAGRKGVAVNASYDFWTPARHYQAYHGGVRILSESAGVRLATPITVTPDKLNEQALGYSPRQPSWNFLEPWPGGDWHLRDIVNDQLLAMESCLYTAAIRRQDFLKMFLTVGRRAVSRTSPYAFVISARQGDPGAARRMLETLAFGAVEIERASAPFDAAGTTYPAASYVIPMAQPYSSYAKTLLEVQHYPDLREYPNGPPRRPYDVTAQTLPLLMGVEVDTIEKPFEATLARARAYPFPPRRTRRNNGALPATDTDSWREINRLWSAGSAIYRDPQSGDFASSPQPDWPELKRPRVGLYKSWMPNIDEGWTRWLLDEFGFIYTRLTNQDIQAGALRSAYDVIVFPSAGLSAMTNGYRLGAMPEELTGGIGQKGAEALKQFAQQGGRLIFLNQSAAYASDVLGIPLTDVTKGMASRDLFVPGSLLNVTLDSSHPLTRGLPDKISIWCERSPAFEAAPAASIVARYNSANLLASGWLLGEKYLVNKSALLDLPVGQGRAIVFGFQPQYRAQSYQAFKLFFNALLLN
ncbi:MAG: M14 metallopeptidase family protein [Bryobacteraceae bacterium]